MAGGSSSEAVKAHVGLRSPSGLSVHDATPSMLTAQNIQQLVASPDTRERAKAWLQAQGFHVERVSPLTILVEGPRERFENVFKGRLTRLSIVGDGIAKAPVKISKAGGSRASKTAAVGERGASAGSAKGDVYWDWAQPPSIPPEVRDMIGSVTLPQPVRTLS